jgi:hypothetical protein
MSYSIGEYDLGILFILLLVNGFDVSIDSVITTHSLIHCSTLVPFSCHHHKVAVVTYIVFVTFSV